MHKTIISILISFIIISTFLTSVSAIDDPTLMPDVSLDYPKEVAPNQQITIRVRVKNTVNDRMWDTLAYIDEDSMTKEGRSAFQIITGRKLFPVQMDPGQEETVELTLRIAPDALGGEYLIPVVVATGIGWCREGCVPSLVTVNSPVNVRRSDPLLTLEFDRYQIDVEQGICEVELVVPYLPNVPFKISNINPTESAYTVRMTVTQDAPMVRAIIDPTVNQNILSPGEQITGSLYIRTSYEAPIGNQIIRVRLTYSDKYGTDYDLSRDITVTVKNVGKNFYDQGKLFYDACDYDNAKISLMQAREIYRDNNNILMVQEIDKLVKRMDANDKFMQGQNKFFAGDFKNAITYYSEAKTLYSEINDCQAVQLSEDAIRASSRPASVILPGITGTGADSIATFSIHTVIQIILISIIGILLIIIFRDKKGGGGNSKKINIKEKLKGRTSQGRPSQKPLARPSQAPIRRFSRDIKDNY